MKLPEFPSTYSCEIVRSDMPQHRRLWRSGALSRTDHFVSGVCNEIDVTNRDTGEAFTLYSDCRECLRIVFDKSKLKNIDPDAEFDWIEEKREVVDGRPMLYLVLYHEGTRDVWQRYTIDLLLNFRIRIESFRPDGSLIFTGEWRNISLEAPDPKLFEVPQGYKIKKMRAPKHIR